MLNYSKIDRKIKAYAEIFLNLILIPQCRSVSADMLIRFLKGDKNGENDEICRYLSKKIRSFLCIFSVKLDEK